MKPFTLYTVISGFRIPQDCIYYDFHSVILFRSKGVENPSLEQYMYNERKIIVSKSNMIIKGSNARGRKDKKTVIDVNDTRQLIRRPKKKYKKVKSKTTKATKTKATKTKVTKTKTTDIS